MAYKYIAGLNQYRPIDLQGLSDRLNSPHANWLAAKLNAEAITVLKNTDSIIPLKSLDEKKIAVLSIGETSDCEFQQMIARYAKVAHFSILRNTPAATVQQIYQKLASYDVVICGVHTVRIPESMQLRQLAEKKELIYAFFTLPYFCKNYKPSIEQAKTVVMAYETTPLAQEYAAQVIFGGIGAKGKLPVTIPSLYYSGTGVFTEKTRLGFHQPEEVGLNPVRLNVIESIVQDGLDAKAYPGCQVLVAKDGMVVYDKAFGKYDYEHHQPVTNASVYDLASASKAAGTLLAVMEAYDDKKFNLNNKVSQYIPELQESDKRNITIKQLLYHQSGLLSTINFYLAAIDDSSYHGSLYSSRKNATHPVRFDAKTYVRNDFRFLPSLVSSTPKLGYTLEVAKDFYLHASFRDSIMQQIKDSRLGTKRYRYSCINFILLKELVERCTDQPMDVLLDRDFFQPLGAWHTTYNPLKKMDISEIVPTEYDGFLRRQLIRGYVHDEAAFVRNHVVRASGLDLGHIEHHLSHGRGDSVEAVRPQGGDVVEGDIQCIDAFSSCGMSAFASGESVKHQQPPLAGRHLHAGRLADYRPVGEIQPSGHERTSGGEHCRGSVLAGSLLLAAEHEQQVERQPRFKKMAECGNHRYHTTAIVIGSESVDYAVVDSRIVRVAGIAACRRYGVHLGKEGECLFLGTEIPAGDHEIVAEAAVGESEAVERRGKEGADPVFPEGRRRYAYHLPQQFGVFFSPDHQVSVLFRCRSASPTSA